MANKLDDLFGDAKQKGNKLWGNVKNAGKNKLDDTVNNLNEVLPDLKEAGFTLVRLDVHIALLPRLFARFRQVHILDEENRKVIMEKSKDQRFLNLMLAGLFKAAEVRSSLNIDGLDLSEIELEIGLTPSAKLIFREEEKRIPLIKA